MEKKDRKLSQQELREKAEEILNAIARDNEITFPKEIKRILHELQVYRVELEMQFDELSTTQLELEKSRNRYADLYDNGPVGYFTLNQSAEILMLNITGAHMLGFNRTELVGKSLANFTVKADKELFIIFLRNVFSSHIKQTIELSFVNNKNIPFFVLLEAILPEGEDNYRTKQCRIAMIDITERKIAEAQLREREESLREAQEMANLGSWSIDMETGRVKASPQLYAILGIRRSEKILGETLRNFVHPDDKQRLQNLYDKIKLDAKPFSTEYRVLLRDGRERWIYSSNKAQANTYNKITHLTGFIQDITEQKQATELRIEKSKLETASSFARTITHEIRNPLTTVNLGLNMLKAESEKQGLKELGGYINTIERNIKRIDNLITQLLYASRNSQSIFTRTYICDILDEALEQAQDRITLNKVKLIKDYEVNCKLSADKENLKIAFLNLMINALEAIPAKKGKLIIKTEQRHKHCFITIRDNGAGISQEIFKPYFTTKNEGMGLGLFNTNKLIKDNQGTISVESEIGVGTSFIVSFPIL